MAKLDDLIQQKQQRDEDWKAKKTAEREELGQLSDDAVMHVTSEPGAYLHYLDTQAINPRYSASNVMLAMAQNPDITYINSLEVWNRLGRSVNRDENGMKIRVSDTYVKDGREYHGYKIGRVFDISQTHGKAGVPALSLKDNTPEMDAALRRLLDSSPVPVVTSSTMYQDAVYDPKTQSITVSSRLIDSKILRRSPARSSTPVSMTTDAIPTIPVRTAPWTPRASAICSAAISAWRPRSPM